MPNCLINLSLPLGVAALFNQTLDSDIELVWDLVR